MKSNWVRFLTTGVVVLFAASLTGCFDGLDMDEMRQRAGRSRQKDDDEEAPQKAPPPAAESAANSDTGDAIPMNAEAPKPAGVPENSTPATSALDTSKLVKFEPKSIAPEQLTSNLETVGVALKRYVEKNSATPAQAIITRGVPNLSWRVALLPYLGHNDLYNQFKLNEPWDSAHNRQLLDYMPSEYHTGSLEPGTTQLMGVKATSSIMSLEGMVSRNRVEDGLANTVLLAVASPDRSVPWTKPEDLDLTAKLDLLQFNTAVTGMIPAVWCDGSVYFIKQQAGPEEIAKMFTIDGGDKFSRDFLVSSFEYAKIVKNAPVGAAAGTAPAEIAGSPGQASSSATGVATEIGEMQLKAEHALRSFEKEESVFPLWASGVMLDPIRHKSEIGWYPALQRPSTGLRIGIGLSAPPMSAGSSEYNPIKDKLPKKLIADKLSGVADLEKFTGDIGTVVAATLHDRMSAGDLGGLWTSLGFEDPRTNKIPANLAVLAPQPIRPGLQIVGTGARGHCVDVCQKLGLDVLVLIEVKVQRTNQNRVHNTTQVYVIDAIRGTTLFESKKLSNFQQEVSQVNALIDNPIEQFLGDFREFVKTNLVKQELPTISPEAARERIKYLLDKTEKYPWYVSANEVVLYLDKGLISRVEYDQAMNAILSVPAGKTFSDSSLDAKLDYVRSKLDRDAKEIWESGLTTGPAKAVETDD